MDPQSSSSQDVSNRDEVYNSGVTSVDLHGTVFTSPDGHRIQGIRNVAMHDALDNVLD